MKLVKATAARDDVVVSLLLAANPTLAKARFQRGATRRSARTYYIGEIGHYVYAGDTALHLAAAAHQEQIVQRLISIGADIGARNRRGAELLHYAADGVPGAPSWNAAAQAATVALLIKAGADPNSFDDSGVSPLHRAVRARCAAAVRALLEGGADPRRKNKSGSTPMLLATQNTGRGGTGSLKAKAQQECIVRLLKEYIAKRG